MKRIKKIAILTIGMIAVGFLLSSNLSKSSQSIKDMEAARGSAPSSSYQYHLQIFHAF